LVERRIIKEVFGRCWAFGSFSDEFFLVFLLKTVVVGLLLAESTIVSASSDRLPTGMTASVGRIDSDVIIINF
jgi:nitrate reductase gamma subunit